MSRRRNILARQVSLFPVLLLVDEDDATGRLTLHPLPVELQWRWGVSWLALVALGWLGQLKRRLAAWLWPALPGGWRVRLSLEVGMAIILGRQLGLAVVGR
ncbi:MAG: hypothetical protein Kow0031_09060 [Anaerolineae bacterium]